LVFFVLSPKRFAKHVLSYTHRQQNTLVGFYNIKWGLMKLYENTAIAS